MTNTELIAAHHLAQVRLNLMATSIEKRDESITVFARAIEPRSLMDVTRQDIEAFLDSRVTRRGPIVARTRYAWLSHLHSFYEWAIREEFTADDPTAKIARPKMHRGLPRPAATTELSRALSGASPRHRCWMLLAAYEGLRCQEIAGLSRGDVLDGDGLLKVVKAKGGTERMLPLVPAVLDALRELPMPRLGRVFIRPRGGPYRPVNLSQEFNAFLRSAGVDATAHQLRHWFGTNLYAQSHDIRLTQEMLGHSSPATTAIYTAFDTRAAGAAMRAMSFDLPEPEPEAA
jgi:site-specific recombinase XerD